MATVARLSYNWRPGDCAPMHDGRKIANLLLSEFDPTRFDITNLKLNKVLFFVHAFYLVRHSEPLVRNHFEAWEHGPVVRVVYHEFKSFERAPITSLAKHLNYESGQTEVIGFDDIGDAQRAFILKIASHYMQFSASRLRDMTHVSGGPWDEVYSSSKENRGIRDRIPNEIIRKHFANEYGGSEILN